jgi:hypothetical protein
MGKRDLKMNVTVDGDDVKLTISEEVRNKIPRVGDSIYVIKPYPVDDDDEDKHGKIKEDAILAYSYAGKVVKTTALNDEADAVTINGDFQLPLNSDMTIQTNKLMVFTKEEDAKEKFRTLMNSSVEAARELQEKYESTVKYLEEAIEKVHH